MERLTHRYIDGEAWASIFEVCACGENECKGPIIDRLAAYEDTGLSVKEASELAGKHMPKKTRKVSDGGVRYTSDYRCPSCGGAFTGTGIADYCYHCGQRLDWESGQ